MAILSNSWAEHLKNIAGNDDANKNMKAYTDALPSSKTRSEMIDALVEEVDTGILLVGPKNSILRTHSWKKFGGTRSRPVYSVGCLIGSGPTGQGVEVDIASATSTSTISIASATEISNCKTVLDFENLGINVSETDLEEEVERQDEPNEEAHQENRPRRSNRQSSGGEAGQATINQAEAAATARTSNTTATRVRGGSRSNRSNTRRSQGQGGRGSGNRRSSREGAAETTNAVPTGQPTTQTIEMPSVFIMAPFLCNAIFEERSSDPLQLIIAAREAATEFDARHRDAVGFEEVSAANHVEAFTNWALATHLGKLTEARVSPNPDNIELQRWADTRNRVCILPTINTAESGISQGVNNDTFKILGEGLKRMGEAADEANLLKRKEIKQRKDESEEKKDRIKDMHPTISNMILMASSADSQFPGEHPDSFKSFFNSKTQAYADLELNNLFEERDIYNVGFAEGTVLALYTGHLRRSNPTAPSNCTPFAFRELQAAQMTQKSRSIICTMITHKGNATHSADELKAKAKQDVVAPTDYNEMIFQLEAFAALMDILFGNESILTKKLTKLVRAIKLNAITYKARSSYDDRFPSKVLWAVCNRVQSFLTSCWQAKDREEVDDDLIEFTSDHKDIILNSFNPALPPCFKEVTKKEATENDQENNNDNEKSQKNKKRKKEHDAKQQKKQGGPSSAPDALQIKNDHQCEEFKMKEGERWSMFKAAGNSGRAQLNGLPMCARWHTRGSCFSDCKHKASHVKCSEVPSDVKEAHVKWMKKARREE